MNAVIIFIIATIVNVTLSTIRALCTIKGGKWLSATTNAVCYGFYPLIVMLTAKGTVDILINMLITAVVNFVCVWIIKLIEEKARKDKMWKVEIAVPNEYVEIMHKDLNWSGVEHNYTQVGSWTMFNCYCMTQLQTKHAVEYAKAYKGKYSAYESKMSI